ncbi:MAG TPA: hypothetical protein VNO54_02025, partial [Streptosporangiaceae bacterium]|nr:hypothetical protein [Streptosporangiaceae bacterium]
MTYYGYEAFPALSDEQWARLQAYAGAILAAVPISSPDSREHAQAARNERAAAAAAAANPASQPARVHRRPGSAAARPVRPRRRRDDRPYAPGATFPAAAA